MTAPRALITGAGGFVGARLAEHLLAQGASVVLLIRPDTDRWRIEALRGDAEVREVDLRDADAVRRVVRDVRPDWLLHLAAHGAYSWQSDPRVILHTNLMGTLNLLEAAADTDVVSFVHAGSSSEYGFKDHAPGEDDAPEPNSHYAVAKAAATLLGQYVGTQGDLRVTTLRLSSVYGPWEEPRRLVPQLISRGLRGELPPLVGPRTVRDFVHVDDVCAAFAAIVTADGRPGSIYNVGSGVQTTLQELVEVARTELGIVPVPEWGTYEARAWDAKVWVSDPRRIARDLGWRAARDLPTGFAQTVAWLRDRTDLWSRYDIA